MASVHNSEKDDSIQEIYSSFLECISRDKGEKPAVTLACLNDIRSKLNAFKTRNNQLYPDKVNTLIQLIESKIDTIKSQGTIGDDNDFITRSNELGIRFVQKPSKSFKDVQGLESIKRTLLTNVIYPLKFKELSEEFGIHTNGGILFYGPPGNGKTLLAESLAGEAGINFLELNPAFLYNEFFGRFEKNIAEIFKLARETAPNILFFDEVETLIPRREKADHSVVKRGVTQLLIEIGKLINDGTSRTYLVAATNLPWDIDPAMLRPGRFDLKIYVPLPKKTDREAILRHKTQSSAFSKDIDVKTLSEATVNFSTSDLDFILRQSAEQVFYETIETGKRRQVTQEDIFRSISRIKPSSSESVIERYNQFL